MKKYTLFLLMLIVGIVLYSKPSKKGVHSIAAFEQLYKNRVPPFNKISDTTFLRLKSGIAFDAEGNFRGFMFIGGVRKELTFEEYQQLKELIIGQKSPYTEQDKIEYDKRRKIALGL